ncbi:MULTISPECIES: glycosyltransferase family 25 protein [unclassified Sphingobium]|uniref:glycosyltransferase family 25 protein n=1 Tax=unclassified Sphingobium TaxID=2611147 RepID=UPI0022252E43|nr:MULTISPECIES: glycosyltransferase family 25 protein [unclassified Sphingobium]MCW2411891.1 hypothetical protein [Sphingobium sp. B8D3D]
MATQEPSNAAGQALLAAFDRVVIVNLAHRTDRLNEISQQLARLGLSFNHPAVLRFEAKKFDETAGFPTAGTRGCFHSHLGVWREALARGDRSTLLLEDDLDFSSNVQLDMPGTLHALGLKPWSVFYGAVLEWSSAQPLTPPLAEASANEPILGGHFIAMRRNAIESIVPYLEHMLERQPGSNEGGPMHVDGAYSWFRREHAQKRTFVAHPDLGKQRRSRTDIHSLSWKDRLPVVRSLTAQARKFLRR